MKKILVTGASGIIGYGILKSLRMCNESSSLIGLAIYDNSVAPGFCDTFIKAPLTTEEGYMEWLLDIIEGYQVDLVFPGFEGEIMVWLENLDKIEQSSAKFVLNNTFLINLCLDKWKFYSFLKDQDCPYIIPTSLSDNYNHLIRSFDLPWILKPRKGSASRGIVRVYNPNDFNEHKHKIGKELMVQPLVGNDEEEYTTGLFGDGKGGCHAQITFRRKLSKDGYTDKAEVIENDDIKFATIELCKILKPIGPTNFQFRIHKGVCQLLEVNPRVSASSSIRSAFGYNESSMAIDFYLQNKLPIQPRIREGSAVRYIEDFIFYK